MQSSAVLYSLRSAVYGLRFREGAPRTQVGAQVCILLVCKRVLVSFQYVEFRLYVESRLCVPVRVYVMIFVCMYVLLYVCMSVFPGF